jgi:hypothetical protein
MILFNKNTSHNKLRLFTCALAVLTALAVLDVLPAAAAIPQESMTFASPFKAVAALVAAVQDNNTDELLTILGPGSENIIFSGDPVADQHGREKFLQAYNEQHTLQQEVERQAELLVGANDYPFPIPIVQQGNVWFFDTSAGIDEIINRRIGRNELHTIEVMQAYTAAQREYACLPHHGTGTEFAQQFASRDGKKDGLYWPVEPGEAESPFGPLIARATEEGYTGGLDENPPEPFHGYYLKILKAQGEHAIGGAFDYVVNGKMILGFGLVAYPAKYGVSGIMTFIVNQEGVIYEKDLGEDTAAIAAAMTAFDPDDTWHKYDETAGL